ncbi:hypothetical protein H310_00400 [Aphanomyces invadans]|uniref:Uncharacterized protein n=1 Tax=Aphanomyces invadans TaxID=157072 RepID=A0A024UUI3_9STRA|nr:hypothetical protein H310_00400 [Aphanomyces invadans]ETW09989.1 hypothetical protein H310_00400 [Aphanomyces invadans]|eukprot:XP_008861400.1 hypothetical protein H310_00400 [Aphanomyces invadans]
MALPLHPRRAGMYFQTILGRVSDIHARIAAFQRFYLTSLQACKAGAACLVLLGESQDGTPSVASISPNGLSLEVRQGPHVVVTIQLRDIGYVVCSSDEDEALWCRIHQSHGQDVTVAFTAATPSNKYDNTDDNNDNEFTFAQWVLVIMCTATALRQGDQDKSTRLLWQAARLRVVELTCLMGINQTFMEKSPHMEAISFLDAIQDTQRVLHDIAAADASVDLDSCWFLRVN